MGMARTGHMAVGGRPRQPQPRLIKSEVGTGHLRTAILSDVRPIRKVRDVARSARLDCEGAFQCDPSLIPVYPDSEVGTGSWFQTTPRSF